MRPGSNLSLLFQLAEATADSESDRADVKWHYLTGNRWKPLRPGFEVLSDATKSLTRSGIVEFSIPRDISNTGNTLMPPTDKGEHLYWLKVAAESNVAGVAETIGIHTQAAVAVYKPEEGSDETRVGQLLPAGSIAKPRLPDFNIKTVTQHYESFGGRLEEKEERLYLRVSEHLRHKGRSISLYDYEHLVLDAFPQIFKCKCINHTLGLSAHDFRRDLEVAPGYLVVAVIPDLTMLKAGDGLEPKAPVSLLIEIKEFLRKRVSPFARIRVMNPRYEKIRVEIKVRLKPGRNEAFFSRQLKEDLSRFLAPWHLGDSDKLSFGQEVAYSDVIEFVENLHYIEFITQLKLYDEASVAGPTGTFTELVRPATARSILTGGEICVELDKMNCNPASEQQERRNAGSSVLFAEIPLDSKDCNDRK